MSFENDDIERLESEGYKLEKELEAAKKLRPPGLLIQGYTNHPGRVGETARALQEACENHFDEPAIRSAFYAFGCALAPEEHQEALDSAPRPGDCWLY